MKITMRQARRIYARTTIDFPSFREWARKTYAGERLALSGKLSKIAGLRKGAARRRRKRAGRLPWW